MPSPQEQRDEIRVARFAELDALTLHRLLRLRCEVFVAEQRCLYADVDTLDTVESTQHLWIDAADPERPAGYLRITVEPHGAWRIGRVVTAPAARGKGIAGRLLDRALQLAGSDRPVELRAQAHLTDWYTRWGFVAYGEIYSDAGVDHQAMRREIH